ncbi:hypothetical protein BH24PSE2_BH24PSE2_22620 [soil metagenome]
MPESLAAAATAVRRAGNRFFRSIQGSGVQGQGDSRADATRLRNSEALKAAILDTALDCIITIDHEGLIVDFNPAAESTFGYRREEAVSREMCELIIPPALRDPHRRGMARYLATGQATILNRRLELVAMRADGSEFPAELAITPISLDGPPMFTGYLRDITDKKRAEQALQDSEAHFRLMADNAPAMLWTTNADHCCTYVSRRWYEYTGSNPAEIPDSGRLAYIHEDDRAGAERVVHEASGRHEPFSLDYRIRAQGGQHRWVVDSGLPRFDPSGGFQGYVGCVTDVHDRKAYERALHEADRRKDEFLAILAHELRNPLAPIRNAVQLLRLKGPPEPELQLARDVIDRQVEHLTRLIEDLLDVSRITRDNLELRQRVISLTDVIQSAVETSEPIIEQNGHTLTVSLPTEPVYLDGDLIRLAQVFTNLLRNAAKYTNYGGRITLTATRENDGIAVRVADNGAGIPHEMLPKMFDLFFQGDSSNKRTQDGLGIGLSLARRLVELHGGTIEVRSNGIGRGSEFTVRLPMVSQPTAPAGEIDNGREKEQAAAHRILVVDDNQDAADSLAELLRFTGSDVHTFYDGVEALKGAETLRPDVALLDIGMPHLDGCEAARRLRRKPWGKHILLVAVTGWGQIEDRRRTREAGFDAHFVKPIDFCALMELLGKRSPGAIAG